MTDKRRTLIGLGAAALVSVVLAGGALWQRAAEGQPHYTPTEVLPGFAANVKNAAMIQLSSHNGTFHVVNTPGKGWVLPEHGGYPANFDQVRHTLIGLAALQTIAPKTNHADWLHYLSLDAPPKGNGIEITVQDKSGGVLASLILGNTEDLGDPNGTTGLFVRKPDQTQAWLARSVFTPQGDVASWLAGHVADLSIMRLSEIDVTPVKGQGFAIHRAKPTDHVFTLANPPKTGEANPQFVNAIPYAVSSFSIIDAQPVAKVDFSKASHVVAHTFDGLIVSMDVMQQGEDIWARVSAAAAPGASPAIAQEAAGITARSAGWAYKLPPEKGVDLLSDLPRLMTPPPPQQDQGPPGMGGMMPPGMAMP